ncbi:hypothetical protein LZ31DRAFT_584647, partial [Colletotrichum somersetense]
CHPCFPPARPASASADQPPPALQATSSRIRFAGTLRFLLLAVICLTWRYRRLSGTAAVDGLIHYPRHPSETSVAYLRSLITASYLHA